MAVNDHAVLQSLLIVLATAVAIVSLAPRIKICPVVGYLFAGALLGPHATGVIREPESLGFLAELGVALLLFGIGLELSLPKIFALKRWVFGLGAIQVLVTTGGLTGAIMLAGLNWEAALAIGSALSLSSTALVLQLLGERKEYATAFAPVVFAVLLFQDLAVLPLLTIVPGLASPPDVMLGRLAIDLGWAFAALALSLLLGQKLLQPLFRFVARSSHRDILVGTALLAILGAAYGVSLFGLSLALGALLAGLLLSSSEFRHEVEADVRPFKGVLLGFFFMHVGMTADLVSIRDNWLWVTLGGIGLLLIKAGILFCLCLAMRLPRDQAPRIAAYLSQGSEFSFVLLATAVGAGVVLAHDAALALASVLFTMILTPLVVAQAKRLARQRPGPLQSLPTMTEMAGKALIIAGFGRVGHSVARMAAASGRPYLAVDFDSARVTEGRANAFPVFFGDASRLDILQQLGIENAEACVITLDDPLLAENLVRGLRRRYPQLAIYARARDLAHAQRLKNAGASVAVPEAVEGSLQLGARVLEGLGEGPNVVDALIADLREEGYRGL